MYEREKIAARHGFSSFDEMVKASAKLPDYLRGRHPTYLTRHPRGHWFIWDDPVEELAERFGVTDQD
jgi:hypothetical protein